jgi:hypothetical protein
MTRPPSRSTLGPARASARVLAGVVVDGRLVASKRFRPGHGRRAAGRGGRLDLADRNSGSPRLAAQCEWLLASPRGTRRSGQRPPPWLVGKRRRVETVIGQLTGRCHLKQAWARHSWLASVVALAAQAAQSHPSRLPVPADRPRLIAVRRPAHHLKAAHRVS